MIGEQAKLRPRRNPAELVSLLICVYTFADEASAFGPGPPVGP